MEVLFNALQLIGGVILVSGYPSQMRRLVKTKSAKDFSMTWLGSIALGIALMESYAIYCLTQGVAHAFFLTNTIALLAIIVLLSMVIYYQRRSK